MLSQYIIAASHSRHVVGIDSQTDIMAAAGGEATVPAILKTGYLHKQGELYTTDATRRCTSYSASGPGHDIDLTGANRAEGILSHTTQFLPTLPSAMAN